MAHQADHSRTSGRNQEQLASLLENAASPFRSLPFPAILKKCIL
ncbi:hypothetical protein PO124_34530 [Bacillus licheniformis]|nr:hypothetical protein [Bacillus licheniformis]